MFDTGPDPRPSAAGQRRNAPPLISVRDFSLWYGEKAALRSVDLDIFEGEILAFIGPSGCGKTTLLKALNRMHDGSRGLRMAGSITFAGQDVQDPALDVIAHRRRFGWVAQKPNPFAASIFRNVAYGPTIHGIVSGREETAAHVEACLRRARLWDEVKDDLGRFAYDLSGGQQQRLCIARALSTEPEVLLMDEPTGSIDPIAAGRIEELLLEMRGERTIVIITHSMAAARRVADRVAFFHLGRLLEVAPTESFFEAPQTAEARRFVTWAMG